MNWDEHFILRNIVQRCKWAKAKNEILNFHKRLGLLECLRIIHDKSDYVILDFTKLCVAIDKPYDRLTMEKIRKSKSS